MLPREWDPEQAAFRSRSWRKPGKGGLLVMREDHYVRFGILGELPTILPPLELRFIAGVVMGGKGVR